MEEISLIELGVVFLVGLVLGSFATLASYRLPLEEPIGMTRSRCPACARALSVRDLVPLVSWLVARGKCRSCGAGISARYPLIELATAVLVSAVYLRFGVTPASVCMMLLAVCLVIITVVDLEHGIIPDSMQIAMLALGAAYRWLGDGDMMDALLGLLLGLAVGVALRFGYARVRGKEGLGMGDVKFLLVAGTWLGPLLLVPLFLFAGLIGILTALLWKALGKGEAFPFGPALAVALLLCLFIPEIRMFLMPATDL